MSSDLQIFIKAALEVGLAPRLAALTADVDRSIANYPAQADERYLIRLEAQRQRLGQPDLDLIAGVVGALCAEQPERLALIAPIAAQLAPRHACLTALAKHAA